MKPTRIKTSIQGNRIGVNSSNAPFPNGLDGISVSGAQGTTIGGSDPLARNIIAYNGENGIALSLAFAKIEGNSIFNNNLLGIDVFADASQMGVTPNDVNDADEIQNFPVITGVSFPSEGQVLIQGQMPATPSEQRDLYFYGNDACDPSGHGEGQIYLGSAPFIAWPDGQIRISLALSLPTQPITSFTATAWGEKYGSSEFSRCYPMFIYLPLIMK